MNLDRPNIYLSASKKPGSKGEQVFTIVLLCMYIAAYISCWYSATLGGSANILSTVVTPLAIPKTLIFSPTKDAVYKIFSSLHIPRAHKNAVYLYHASQSQETKAYVQSTFKSSTSQLRCLSVTIAFGMVPV